MKITFKQLLLALGFAVTFASCFEIKETVHFNKDGSGSFSFVMDLSALKSLMEMAAMADSTAAIEDPFANADEAFADQMAALAGMNGISAATTIIDKEAYLMGYQFDFANIESLNKALNAVFEDPNGGLEERVFFKMKGKSVERVDALNMKDQFATMMGESGEDTEMESMMMFLQDTKYVTEYSFERKVKSASNKAAQVSGNKVVLEQFLFKEDNTTKLDNIIKLK